MAKPGRKAKQFTAQQLEEIQRSAEIGLTDQMIATIIGTSETTLKRHCAEELAKGRAKGNQRLAKTAFQMAVSGEFPVMTIFQSKVRLGWRDSGSADSNQQPAPTQLVFKRGPDRPSAIRKAEDTKASETPQTELKVINGTE